jgi:hypothetical protein
MPLQVAQHVRPISPSKQRFILLVELYAFTWFLLVGSTVLSQRIKILGLSWIALWNASLLVAVILAVLEGSRDNRREDQAIPPREESEDDQVGQAGEQQETEASETTPLLRRPTSAADSRMLDKSLDFWWMFQLIVSMTAPVLNLATIYSIWIAAMPQTIPDGGWVGIGVCACDNHWAFPDQYHVNSVCTYIVTIVPHSSPIGTLRTQNPPLAEYRHPYHLHRVYHICLVRTSFYP